MNFFSMDNVGDRGQSPINNDIEMVAQLMLEAENGTLQGDELRRYKRLMMRRSMYENQIKERYHELKLQEDKTGINDQRAA